MPLFHLGGILLPTQAEDAGALEPPGCQSRGVWVEKLVTLGLRVVGAGGRACSVRLAVWEEYCSFVAHQVPDHVQGLAGNLQLAWLTGSFVSQAPQIFPFHPVHHLGMAPMPYWVEINSSNHILSLQQAEHNSYIISIQDNLCNNPMR